MDRRCEGPPSEPGPVADTSIGSTSVVEEGVASPSDVDGMWRIFVRAGKELACGFKLLLRGVEDAHLTAPAAYTAAIRRPSVPAPSIATGRSAMSAGSV